MLGVEGLAIQVSNNRDGQAGAVARIVNPEGVVEHLRKADSLRTSIRLIENAIWMTRLTASVAPTDPRPGRLASPSLQDRSAR